LDARYIYLEPGLVARTAAHAGFSDQSQFSRHIKPLSGVPPGQFRTPARIT
jgi:AraC-like DNA-binding protein